MMSIHTRKCILPPLNLKLIDWTDENFVKGMNKEHIFLIDDISWIEKPHDNC